MTFYQTTISMAATSLVLSEAEIHTIVNSLLSATHLDSSTHWEHINLAVKLQAVIPPLTLDLRSDPTITVDIMQSQSHDSSSLVPMLLYWVSVMFLTGVLLYRT